MRSTSIFVSGIFVVTFFALPFYNKVLFSRMCDDSVWNGNACWFVGSAPLTATTVQLFGAFIFLILYTSIFRPAKTRSGLAWREEGVEAMQENGTFFGPKFWVKLKRTFWVSFWFALVIALSNIGLKQVSINEHIILRATSLLFVTLLSALYKEMRPTLVDVLSCLLVAAGVVLCTISESSSWSSPAAAIWPNVVSALAEAFMLVFLKPVVEELTADPLVNSNIFEITAFKLLISGTLIEAVAVWYEWDVIVESSATGWLILGMAVTGGFQLSVVGFMTFCRPATFAVMKQAMIVPQMILYSALSGWLRHEGWHFQQFTLTTKSIIGAILVIIGMNVYALHKYILNRRERRSKGIHGYGDINTGERDML